MMKLHVSSSHFKYMQLHLTALDAAKSKLYSLIPPNKSRKPPENICCIKLPDRAVHLINLSAIFNNASIISKLNKTCNNFPVCAVLNNLGKPICNKIFNFNIFVFSINIDAI